MKTILTLAFFVITTISAQAATIVPVNIGTAAFSRSASGTSVDQSFGINIPIFSFDNAELRSIKIDLTGTFAYRVSAVSTRAGVFPPIASISADFGMRTRVPRSAFARFNRGAIFQRNCSAQMFSRCRIESREDQSQFDFNVSLFIPATGLPSNASSFQFMFNLEGDVLSSQNIEAFELSTAVSGQATVTENFELIEPAPVPVPAALGLLVSALGALPLLSRRRKRAVN